MQEPQELELRRYLRSQRELAARLIEGESLAQVAPRFLEIVANLLRWEAGAIWEVTGADEPLHLITGWSTPDLDAEPLWRRSRELTFKRGTGLPGDAWDTGQIALAPNYSQYPTPTPRFETSAQLGLEAALAIPVPIGDPERVLAVAEFHTTSFEAQSQELIDLLAAFAEQLGTFVARRRAEAKSAEAERFRQHLAEVVRGTQDAVLSKDLDGLVTSWNPAASRLYGYGPEEAIGRHISFLVPPDHKDEEKVILDRVKRGERLDTYETERLRKDGSRISVSLTVSPIRSPMRGLIGASVVARDITAEVRRRRAQEFLVTASRLIDSSLDPIETARTIVSTAVPELAELCLIDFRRADGWLGDSVVAGANPEMAKRLERIRHEKPLDPAGEHPVAQVLRLKQPMIWRDLKAPEVVDKVSQGADHLQLMRDAGYNSAAVVPLGARGRTIGALSFLHAHGDLRYDQGDLDFLAELGERAGLALDNARLYQERDRVAKNLQRGLRPPHPADVEGLEVSVVFEAAGEGIEVGGDLYDVIPTEDGCWGLGRRPPLGARTDAGDRRARRGAAAGQRPPAHRREPQRLRDRDAGAAAARGRRLEGRPRLRRPPRRGAHRRGGPADARGRLGPRRLARGQRRAARAPAGSGGDLCPLHRRLARGRAGQLTPGAGVLRRDDAGTRRPRARRGDGAAAGRRRRPWLRPPARRPRGTRRPPAGELGQSRGAAGGGGRRLAFRFFSGRFFRPGFFRPAFFGHGFF
jgi:PAS domain S-box-containing protein